MAKFSPPRLVVNNPPPDAKAAAAWAGRVMSRMQPGDRLFVPRSVSTVLVVSGDPRIAQAHTIFPDTPLVAALEMAGWLVHRRNALER